jgi:type II secretory pathway pseudopilin PulG
MKLRFSSLIRSPLLRSSRCALTLLEMMVAVTLLAAIMVGLLMMFNQTQKAMHMASQQSDVFENVRAGLQTVGRDYTEVTAFTNSGTVYMTGYVTTNWTLTLPSGENQEMEFAESFMLARVNDQWNGIGYYVADANYGVGSLYRFSYATNRYYATNLFGVFTTPPPDSVHRISDGVVHFLVRPHYVITNWNGVTFYGTNIDNAFTNDLPAFVEIEIGILESATFKQFHSLTDNVPVAQSFLANHAGNIHFFRERVPVRNFVNPYRSNEVP